MPKNVLGRNCPVKDKKGIPFSFLGRMWKTFGKILRCNVQDWSPHMSFILKGSQISALQLKGWFKSKTSIQEYRNGNTKLILNLCMNYMVHVSSTIWKIRNRSSNSISCSDNALSLWFLWRAYNVEDFKWRLHFQIGVAFWRVVLREVYFEGPNYVWRALKTSNLNIAQMLELLLPSN
jgi:hypothetical protein